MTTVWDTSIVIDVFRGNPAAVAYAHDLTQIPVCSEVTRVDVLRGVRSQERTGTERLLSSLRWVALDEPIARRAGDLGRRWRRSHAGISSIDLVVAATAEELDAGLATVNVRHFPMITNLRSPY